MSIGALRQRFVLQGPSVVSDGSGGVITSWTTVANLWGEIRPLSAEKLWNQQVNSQRITHQVVVRYVSAIITGQRLQLGSRLFRIHAVVDPAADQRWLDLLVEEGGEL